MDNNAFLKNTGFKLCPVCASKDLKDRANSFVCNSCGYVYYQNPATATSCIIYKADMLLLIERKNDPGKGLYELPGGFVDYGETLEQGMKRELKEEIGIAPKNLKYYSSKPNKYRFKNVLYHTIDCFFVGKLDDEKGLIAGDDAAKIVWVELNKIDLEKFAFESVKSVVRDFLKKRI